jgi:hypothetical protein
LRNNERFLFRGRSAVDQVELLGSGLEATIDTRSPDNSFLENPGFDSFAGTSATAPTGIPGWTTTGTPSTDLEFDAVNIFLPKRDVDEVRRSLRVKATQTISQRLDKTGVVLSPYAPVWEGIAYNREVGGFTGSLELALGSKSFTVALGVQTGWNVHPFLSTPDSLDAWYRNYVADPLDVRIIVTKTSGAGTFLLLDDNVLSHYLPFDGTWFLPLAGATAFRAGTVIDNTGDTATWTDSIATDRVIQRMFFRVLGRYAPHTTGVATIPDP